MMPTIFTMLIMAVATVMSIVIAAGSDLDPEFFLIGMVLFKQILHDMEGK